MPVNSRHGELSLGTAPIVVVQGLFIIIHDFLFLESRRNSSRPGSKAGSRGSSRRGSDASDFDISDIQSVCSDVSETVGESSRATPRSASRQRGGKPSKIPTPQRRTTPTSKLAKGSKR